MPKNSSLIAKKQNVINFSNNKEKIYSINKIGMQKYKYKYKFKILK